VNRGVALLASALLAACGSMKVTPARFDQAALCVERNVGTYPQFLPVLLGELRAHGYEPVLVSPGAEANACPVRMTYVAVREGDTFLAGAEFRVYRGAEQIGRGRYSHGGRIQLGPEVTTRGKVGAILDALLPARVPRIAPSD